MLNEKKKESEVREKEKTDEPQGAEPNEPMPVLVINNQLEASQDENEQKVVRHAELFEGYRQNKQSLTYPCVFFVRRYLLILVLTVVPGHTKLHLAYQIGSTMYVVTYIARFKPYQ